jgi:hypothetical protein
MWCIYTMEYYSATREQWNYVIYKKMDGSDDCHVKRDSQLRRTNTTFTFICGL